MAVFNTYPMRNSAVIRINFEKDKINTSPEYQRNSDVWTLEKRQLLIDSLLNDYDIPKLYFHVLPKPPKGRDGKEYDYAIIDGRQRLETIWSFLNGEFALASDFDYLKDSNVKAAGMTYPDLGKNYPKLKNMFDSFTLPIICVETDDIELIEDMFSRLNEAVPLNAAEKRNAIGGPMVKAINAVSVHDFFKKNVKFLNRRYQHREVAVKLLYLEDCLKNNERFFDTKKPYLDELVRRHKKDTTLNAIETRDKVNGVLAHMHNVFVYRDDLLATQSPIPVYFLLFREAALEGKVQSVTRSKFVKFGQAVDDNRRMAEADITKANYDWLEYDRMSQQGTNDSASIKERLRIISDFFKL